MNPASYEFAVQEAAAALPPQQFAEFRRLARELAAYRSRWGLFLLQYEQVGDRDGVAAAIDQVAGTSAYIFISEQQHPDWPSLEATITAAAEIAPQVQLFGLDDWLSGTPDVTQADTRLHAWNIRREAFSRNVAVPVLCWLRAATLTRFAQLAPDLWSWRTGAHDFSVNTEFIAAGNQTDANMWPAYTGDIDNRTAAQRTHRINEIRQFLDHPSTTSPALRAMLSIEMADLLVHLGSVDSALHILRDELLPMLEQAGDDSMGNLRLVTLGKIADALYLRGELDQALQIRVEQEIPGYLKWGDKLSCAVTKFKVSDVLRVQGKLNEALQILQQEVQPVFDEMGGLHMHALAIGKIADVLEAKEAFDEALELRLEKELPAHQQLNDQRSQAITETKIADTYLRQGHLDDALHLLQDQIVPVFDRLGDMNSRTVAIGKVADAMRMRGDLDEAIRIGRNELLPVFTRLGNMRAVVTTQTNLAIDLWRRSHATDRPEVKELLTSAYATAKRMQLPEAPNIRQWIQSIFLIENPDEDKY